MPMQDLPTVRIVDPKNSEWMLIINQRDFDPKVHVLWEAKIINDNIALVDAHDDVSETAEDPEQEEDTGDEPRRRRGRPKIKTE